MEQATILLARRAPTMKQWSLSERSKEPRPSGRGFRKPRGNLSSLRYELPFLPALPSGASWQIFVTVRFYQEVYNEIGELGEVHHKYPVDLGHRKV